MDFSDSEKILDQDEIDSLLEMVKSGTFKAPTETEESEVFRKVRLYDFYVPNKVTRRALRLSENYFIQIAARLKNALSGVAGKQIGMKFMCSDQISYELALRQSDGITAVIDDGNHYDPFLIAIPDDICKVLSGDNSTDCTDPRIQEIMTDFSSRFIDIYRAIPETGCSDPLALRSIVHVYDAYTYVPLKEICVNFIIEVNIDEIDSFIEIIIPLYAFHRIKPHSTPHPVVPETAGEINSLFQVPAEMRLLCGTLSPSEIAGLVPGQILFSDIKDAELYTGNNRISSMKINDYSGFQRILNCRVENDNKRIILFRTLKNIAG